MGTAYQPHVYRFADITPNFDAVGNSLHQHFGSAEGAAFAGGVVLFRDSEMDWTVWYNEMLICHAVEEKFEIVIDGKAHEMKAGDIMMLPVGTRLIYRSKGTTTLFFAVAPANWDGYQPG